ncbi:uncharacterized protein LOC143260515 [Megalopta genalis]|uniref:uncharacterized protein LOC143260515 n=1 Tax=Megalopta genalis TaxID=115081 RepID=UPI003FD40C61
MTKKSCSKLRKDENVELKNMTFNRYPSSLRLEDYKKHSRVEWASFRDRISIHACDHLGSRKEKNYLRRGQEYCYASQEALSEEDKCNRRTIGRTTERRVPEEREIDVFHEVHTNLDEDLPATLNSCKIKVWDLDSETPLRSSLTILLAFNCKFPLNVSLSTNTRSTNSIPDQPIQDRNHTCTGKINRR